MKKKLQKMAAGLVMMVVCAVLGTGFTVIREGYELYQTAVEQQSLEDRIREVKDQEGYTEIGALPETYLDAVVSVEDHRFYGHCGLDFIAIGRAVLHDVQAGSFVEGGSTITQQLAKNLYFSQEKKMERKIAEVFAAFDLEKQYSKDEILELYVNSIYFGDGYDNVGQASEGYFGKEPAEMNAYECTLLAGVPNAPSKYAPTKNPELAQKRQKQVLRRMEACGCFTREEVETVAVQMIAMEK